LNSIANIAERKFAASGPSSLAHPSRSAAYPPAQSFSGHNNERIDLNFLQGVGHEDNATITFTIDCRFDTRRWRNCVATGEFVAPALISTPDTHDTKSMAGDISLILKTCRTPVVGSHHTKERTDA